MTAAAVVAAVVASVVAVLGVELFEILLARHTVGEDAWQHVAGHSWADLVGIVASDRTVAWAAGWGRIALPA